MNYVMFSPARGALVPFSSKVMEAVVEALEKDKPCPFLREWDGLSLLIPDSPELGKDVPATFSVGKLLANRASTQFKEEMPKIRDALLTTEFEARTRLKRTLNSFCLIEMLVTEHGASDTLKALLKSQGESVT